uniref:Uncharacterized protein n=1 Tax=Anguilla anguilla TaxID=7936 RepID=A0A0E9XHQ7_ANGAN
MCNTEKPQLFPRDVRTTPNPARDSGRLKCTNPPSLLRILAKMMILFS